MSLMVSLQICHSQFILQQIYDDFMVYVLKNRSMPRDSKREICRWNTLFEDMPSIFESQPDFYPTIANPVVFYFHGHQEAPESIVLTEDDYLEFLANIARNLSLIP